MLLNVKFLASAVIVFLLDTASCSDSNPIYNNECVKKCAITADYTPFCGSDNQTYPTNGFLSCFQDCKIQITKAYDGSCKLIKKNPIFDDPCVKNCAITDDYTPFCGSDNQEYPTKSYLDCFQRCQKHITKAHDGKCQQPAAPVQQNPIFNDPCVKNCPITADYSPFCGSDNQEYPTKGYLTCFTNCKKPITMAHEGKCH